MTNLLTRPTHKKLRLLQIVPPDVPHAHEPLLKDAATFGALEQATLFPDVDRGALLRERVIRHGGLVLFVGQLMIAQIGT